MASQRAVVTLAKPPVFAFTRTIAAATTPGRIRAVTVAHSGLVMSQCRDQRWHTSPTGRRPSSSIAKQAYGPTPSIARRLYSTDAGKPSKIWDFDAIQKLTTDPTHSVTLIGTALPLPPFLTLLPPVVTNTLAFYLDVREPNELKESGFIPGAINIPVSSTPDSFHITAEEFEDRFGYSRPPTDAEVVFYCRAGVRSRAAANLAKDAGWEKVGEYPGSWLDWAGKGGKVER
ncbi:Rhodanese-like domain-containing protein [Dichotomopilus funicola]|uniref:Rhodanese-like domain-containing protein n=1 Tax=Dichotomopilus funicola TaxID=1934379 RepID=A0AAN6V6X4_9PEZI|nr:Rhodanese-like domain-containing protein [Dichotomopilus funicola]